MDYKKYFEEINKEAFRGSCSIIFGKADKFEEGYKTFKNIVLICTRALNEADYEKKTGKNIFEDTFYEIADIFTETIEEIGKHESEETANQFRLGAYNRILKLILKTKETLTGTKGE